MPPPADLEAVLYRAIGWKVEGPISECIGWHAHPALGIEGHLHGGSYTPHTHLPRWDWDLEPLPIRAVAADV